MPRPNPIPPERQPELLAAYKAGESKHQLSKRFECSRAFLTDFLTSHGVTSRTHKETTAGFPLRHDAFADSDNDPTAAYWVGFIMTDGGITWNGTGSRKVVLQLAERDAAHLESFRTFLGGSFAIQSIPPRDNGKVRSGPARRVDVVSAQLVADLARYGVVPRKTKTAKVIGLENNPHFWRGAIDGDGTVRVAKRSKGNPYPLVTLVGSEPLVNQFRTYILSITDAKATVYFSRGVWVVNAHSRHAIAVIRTIYNNDGPSLDRKAATARLIIDK